MNNEDIGLRQENRNQMERHRVQDIAQGQANVPYDDDEPDEDPARGDENLRMGLVVENDAPEDEIELPLPAIPMPLIAHMPGPFAIEPIGPRAPVVRIVGLGGLGLGQEVGVGAGPGPGVVAGPGPGVGAGPGPGVGVGVGAGAGAAPRGAGVPVQARGRGFFDAGRGRGDNGRGDNGRGRGDASRGRGEVQRGRGEMRGRGRFMGFRGRGDGGRGRGDDGRGRGDGGRGRGRGEMRGRGDYRGRGGSPRRASPRGRGLVPIYHPDPSMFPGNAILGEFNLLFVSQPPLSRPPDHDDQ